MKNEDRNNANGAGISREEAPAPIPCEQETTPLYHGGANLPIVPPDVADSLSPETRQEVKAIHVATAADVQTTDVSRRGAEVIPPNAQPYPGEADEALMEAFAAKMLLCFPELTAGDLEFTARFFYAIRGIDGLKATVALDDDVVAEVTPFFMRTVLEGSITPNDVHDSTELHALREEWDAVCLVGGYPPICIVNGGFAGKMD